MITPGAMVANRSDDAESIAGRRTVARAMRIGMWIWPSFALLDAYMCLVAYPGAPLGLFLAYRIAIEGAFFLVYRAARRGRMPLGRLFRLQNLCYSAAAAVIALMAVDLGGLASPYMHGISVVALVRATLVPTHWRLGFRTYVRIALSFPMVMGFGAALSPVARAEWLDPPVLIAFAGNYVFVLASSFIGLMTGHLVWTAQEQVYRARRVGRYRLQAPIGKGGMGEVWLAWDESLRRNVALKILRVSATAGAEAVRRFEREAQAAGQLIGNHVVRIFDFGASEDGLYYIAMEYLVGMNLATAVEQFGPMPAARVVRLGIQACLALEEAHAAGIIHRDLKPHNLYLTRTPEEPEVVKLLDFGIARLRDDGTGPRLSRLTRTGAMVGTPAYLAPELWLGGEADERSDIYSLGVTLHFMLTGRTPAPGTAGVGSSEGLERLLGRCLARAPEDRVQSARDLRTSLEAMTGLADWTALDAERFWQRAERERFG